MVGKKILVNNYPMTIVGVSAAGFAGLDPARSPQIRVPILMKPAMLPEWTWLQMDDRRSRWVQVFARLKPGYTVESARAPLQGLFHQIREYETTLPARKDWSAYAAHQFLRGTHPGRERPPPATSDMRNNFSTALIVLMCMVGLVLLIACANVANLLIARAFARQKEIAVRLSMGASRGQLVRQLLVESLVLSLAGGVAGIVLAVAMTRGLLALVPVGGESAADQRAAGSADSAVHARPDVSHRPDLRLAAGAAGEPAGSVDHAEGRRGIDRGRGRLPVPAQRPGHRAGGVELSAAVRRGLVRAQPAESESQGYGIPRPRQSGDVPAVARAERIRCAARGALLRRTAGPDSRRSGRAIGGAGVGTAAARMGMGQHHDRWKAIRPRMARTCRPS